MLCMHGRSPQNAGRACVPLMPLGTGCETGRGTPALHCHRLAAPTLLIVVWAMTAGYAATDCAPRCCVAFATRNSTDKGSAHEVTALVNPKLEALGWARFPGQTSRLSQRNTEPCAVLASASGETAHVCTRTSRKLRSIMLLRAPASLGRGCAAPGTCPDVGRSRPREGCSVAARAGANGSVAGAHGVLGHCLPLVGDGAVTVPTMATWRPEQRQKPVSTHVALFQMFRGSLRLPAGTTPMLRQTRHTSQVCARRAYGFDLRWPCAFMRSRNACQPPEGSRLRACSPRRDTPLGGHAREGLCKAQGCT